MFVPTYLHIADSKCDSCFAPSGPGFSLSHTGVSPIPILADLVLSFDKKFWNHDFSHTRARNTDERKTNKFIVTGVCTTNQIIHAITRYTNRGQMPGMS